MIVETENLKTVKSVAKHLGIEKDYFRILMQRNKIVGETIRIEGTIYFIADLSLDSWGITAMVKSKEDDQ